MQTSMGAANLMRSGIVAADVGGNILGPLVKAGLPALQTSMPSYYDVTPQQISDLAAYVHYLRQMGKYKEFMAAQLPVGTASEGKTAFDKEGGCAGCHTRDSLSHLVKTSSPQSLKAKLLMPDIARPKEGGVAKPGAAAHAKFTENASRTDVANVLIYLRELQ